MAMDKNHHTPLRTIHMLNHSTTRSDMSIKNVNGFQSTSQPHPRTHTPQQHNPRPRYTNSHLECELCGYKGHVASQGCYNMVDNHGKRVTPLLPTALPCESCTTNTRRLHHPSQLCPFRPKFGPFWKKQQLRKETTD